jgi:hypothetical protein
MKIELHIEVLVLHGFAPEDRHRIGEAVERELASLLGEQGIPSLNNDLEIEDMNAGEIAIARGARPEATGAQIARAVYKEMRK